MSKTSSQQKVKCLLEYLRAYIAKTYERAKNSEK